MTNQPAENAPPAGLQPITQDDFETTIRVLNTVNQFQTAIHKTGGLRGGVYFSSEYKTSLQPAAEAIAAFQEWFRLLTPNTSDSTALAATPNTAARANNGR